MATGLGEAIGLQNTTKQQGDPLSWLRLAGAEKRAAKAQSKKDEQKLISDADFNIPYEKGILKPWGKQIARVKGALLEQYWKDAQIDSVTAYNKFYTNLGAAKAEVGSLLASNSNALEYTKLDKATNLVDEKYQLMLNTDVDFAQLAKYAGDTGLSPYVNINDQGAFSYTQTPVFDTKKEVKWERADFNNKKYLTETKRPSGVMGTSLITSENRISDESVVRKTQQVGQSPQARNAFLFENRSDPEIRRLSQSTNIADHQLLGTKVGEFYHNKIKELVPPPILEEEKFEEDKPSSDGSAKKYASEPSTETTSMTMRRPVYNSDGTVKMKERIKGADGKLSDPEIEYEFFNAPVRGDQPVNTKSAIAVSANNKMINVETNESLKGAKGFEVRPTRIFYTLVRDNPKDPKSKLTWKPMVHGTIVQVVNGVEQNVGLTLNDPDDPKKTEKIFEVFMAYEGAVKEAIDAGTNTYKFRNMQKELDEEVRQGSGGKGTMIIVTLNGEEGTIPEDQWASFKKTYPKATRK